MDYQLLALIGMMAAAVLAGLKLNFWWRPGDPREQYRRVFSAGAVGLLLFGAGLNGWELSNSHGWFRGTRWLDGPVWWQVAAGAALLCLAAVWARRVPAPPRQTGRAEK